MLPSAEERLASDVNKGDVLRHPEGSEDEVLAVAVVLHMASGVDLCVEHGQSVSVVLGDAVANSANVEQVV